MVSRVLTHSSFMAHFAVIEITRSTPEFPDIRKKVGAIQPISVTLFSFLLMVISLIAGKESPSAFSMGNPLFIISCLFIPGVVLFAIAVKLFSNNITYLYP